MDIYETIDELIKAERLPGTRTTEKENEKMETMTRISDRVSVCSDNGRVLAVIDQGLVEHSIECGASCNADDINRAYAVARREAWRLDMFAWQERAHKAVMDAERETCERCVYRNGGGGCLGAKCPVFLLLECVNKAGKRIMRTVKELNNKDN